MIATTLPRNLCTRVGARRIERGRIKAKESRSALAATPLSRCDLGRAGAGKRPASGRDAVQTLVKELVNSGVEYILSSALRAVGQRQAERNPEQ